MSHLAPLKNEKDMKTIIKFVIVNRRSVAQVLRAIADLID
jgi:hypothetical protein